MLQVEPHASKDLEKAGPPEQTIARDSSDPITVGVATNLLGIPLYGYNQVPTFLRGNPHITDGYRAHLSTELCVKSSFIWTNETLNVWSHLLGFLYFSYLFLEDNFSFLPNNNGTWKDHFIFSSFNLCFQACMLCSAGYHTFACQSEIASRKWLSIDLAGVSVGLCGCYVPGAYYAFYCDQMWQWIYMTVMLILGLCSVFAQLHHDFLSSHWYMRRLFLYSAFIFAGMVPVEHWVIHSGGIGSDVVQALMPKILVMYVLATLGGFFYVSKIPERFFPGQVNYIGSSHQWWHLMVVLAFSWAHHCAVVILTYWRTHPCPVPSVPS